MIKSLMNGSVYLNPDGTTYIMLDYVRARKMIYFAKYREIATIIQQFLELKTRLRDGEDIQIDEVDGPIFSPEYIYNQTIDGSILITTVILKALFENSRQVFPRYYSGLLVGVDLKI